MSFEPLLFMSNQKVFISHTAPEAKLAICLKDWIESTFAGYVNVFVSSDQRDLRAGDKWFDEIDAALNAAEFCLSSVVHILYTTVDPL